MIQKILMADDDINVWYTCLKNCFEALGLLDKIDTAKTPEGALSKIQATEYDVVLLDISFSAGNKEGIGLISEICKLSPGTDIVMMTTYASEETIAECMQRGASDFISKDDLTDEEAIRACLDAALERSSKKKSNQNLGKTLAENVGATFVSKSMKNLYSEICHVRKESKMHVLVTGESGTGKELVAKAIARVDQDAPFISVNSACFGKDLLEGELFGHEKGSFTGADKQKLGLFELANGGDIFFDEIATLPLDHQSKLLRVLQSGEFFRIGGTKVHKTTARVIAATNEDLDDMVRSVRT